MITCSHSATFKPYVDWQISFPVVATVLQAPSGNHFQHKLSVLESYYANRKWFLPLTRPPSSPPPSRESSHSSLGAVSPAVTGRIGPSELSHLGAPSHRRWMAGSGQSDVEPLHQERRPWSWMPLGRMHVHGDHLPSRSSAHRGCDRSHQKPSCSSQTSRPCCAANKGVFFRGKSNKDVWYQVSLIQKATGCHRSSWGAVTSGNVMNSWIAAWPMHKFALTECHVN